jgi:hypothetical protein
MLIKLPINLLFDIVETITVKEMKLSMKLNKFRAFQFLHPYHAYVHPCRAFFHPCDHPNLVFLQACVHPKRASLSPCVRLHHAFLYP